MEELDLLKKDWKKKENSFNQVSEKEIYGMLHKKSSSIVKWILIISILEVALWASISIIFNTDDYLNTIEFENLKQVFTGINYFNYSVILVFICLFYKNYMNISTTVSTKKLMKDILKTRKTVQYYVAYNLTMMVFCLFFGFFLAFNYNPQVYDLKVKLSDGNHALLMFLCILFIVVFVAVFIGLFWLFYRLLYGILLSKLHRNYYELKKIDL